MLASKGGQVVAEAVVDKAGVGEVFITAGQSNSANFGTPKQTAKDDRVVYLDGKALASREAMSKPDMATHVFKIGAGTDAEDNLPGDIAGVRFYRRALEAAEDAALAVALRGAGATVAKRDGFTVLQIPAQATARQLRLYLTRLDAANLAALQKGDTAPLDLTPLTRRATGRRRTASITSSPTADSTATSSATPT